MFQHNTCTSGASIETFTLHSPEDELTVDLLKIYQKCMHLLKIYECKVCA